ncbi:myosin-11-like [Amphibalanus amphitrite]|uniref:myosin-11-like n=1 Tax=Amphibalanus amphitrite TaxID=1232801 RepID=UPI001C90FC50|nr:myosin-11-like [Amphibalanus amphitrite]
MQSDPPLTPCLRPFPPTQVSIQQSEKRRAPSRFSIMVRRSMHVAAAAVGVAAAAGRPRPLLDSTVGSEDTTAGDQEHQNLLQLVESLRHQLVESRRENVALEARIRQELCAEFEQHVVQIERDWQERIQETERYMESRAEMQLTAVAAGIKADLSRKRRRTETHSDEEEDEELKDFELEEARQQLAAAEQRCQLLEQQLEAVEADRQQAAERAAQRQQELGRLAVQLAEQRDTAQRLERERDEAEQRHQRLLESSGAEQQSVAAELGRQVKQLQEELHFREMDLRELREYLQEGGDELLEREADTERLQRQVTELQQQLVQRDEALRDQQALHADLEQLLASRSQRVDELEARLERRAAPPAIQEESGEQSNPADASFGSRLRALRSMTGAVLRQVTRTDGERQPSPAPPQPATTSQPAPQTTEQESQTEKDAAAAAADEEQQLQLCEIRAQVAELQCTSDELKEELRAATDRLDARTAECAELRSKCEELERSAAAEIEPLRQQLSRLTEERDRVAGEAQRELEELQRQYKEALHHRSEAEADAAVCEREMKTLRAQLERERHGDGSLQERLRAAEAEATVIRESRDQVNEALRIIKAELEAKSEELRQNNAVELRAQLERSRAETSHLRDEIEKRSNELLKLNIHLEGLKRQLVERDEDLQKARDDRSRAMQMSEQNIRRKNEELNRERNESLHLRDMMARLTPRSSSTLQSELESVRADCRRKDDRIEQLEARLRQSELATCTPTPRSTCDRSRSVQIVEEEEEGGVTPMVLRGRSSRSSRRTTSRAPPPPAETDHSETEGSEHPSETGTGRRRRTRRAANAVRFTDENAAASEVSESGSTASGAGRPREPLSALSEQQMTAVTPADQPAPPRTVKSTGTKRKLFKRSSDQIMECSPVEVTEKRVTPRTVVTRSLRSRKK